MKNFLLASAAYALLGLAVASVAQVERADATIASSQTSVRVQGNGSTAVFNYPFLIPYQSDGVTPAVTVQVEDTGGNLTTLNPTQFTITGVGNGNGGTVGYTLSGAPLPSGYTLIISRSLAYTQPIAVSNVSFYPHTVEVTSDNLDAQIQQLATGYSYSLQFPLTDGGGFTLPPAVQRENLCFGFNAMGAPALVTCGSGGGGGGTVPGGANTQVQFNHGGAFAGSAALTVGQGVDTDGLLVTATNPNAANQPTDVTLARFTTTQSSIVGPPTFGDTNGLEVYQNSTFGYNAEASGPPSVQAKETFGALSIFAQHGGDGQMIGLSDTIYCYGGTSDCGTHSFQLLSSGVAVSGNEGNTGLFDSSQQDFRQFTTTILTVLAPATCNTTITPALTGLNVDQTFAVASTTGCNVGDWVRINEQTLGPSNTVQAAKIDGVGSGTLTATVYYSTPAGATVLPAQVLALNTQVGPANGWGQNRVIACTSCTPITAGTVVLDGNGSTVDGTTTNFTAGMVNGDAKNPGVFVFNADTWTGGPATTTFVSYYQISAVTDTTHLNIYKTDVAGSSAVITKCVTACSYKVLPGAAMLLMGDGVRLPSNEVVMDGPPSMWTGLAGQTVAERIGPFTDSSFGLYEVGCWTNGCVARDGLVMRNAGGREYTSGLRIDTSGFISQSGADGIAWMNGILIQSAATGISITGGTGSIIGVQISGLTGNGVGFFASNSTGGNTGIGLELGGWGTGIEVDGTQPAVFPGLAGVGNRVLYTDASGVMKQTTVGTSCAGSPTSSFATNAQGIVTHC